MKTTFDADDLRVAARRIARGVADATDELNGLDGQLGDGDLGVTVSRGWQAVATAMDSAPDDIGKAFLTAGKAFQSASSSSFGTLVATAFMAAAKTTNGRTVIELFEVPAVLTVARDAMMARGKAALGDKTVLDSLDAVIRTLATSEPATMLTHASEASAVALEDFRAKPSKIGRARMFAEKSIGLDDPGMVAFHRIVIALGGA